MQNQMLSCFFPSTVVFIDDKTAYLRGLLSAIDMNYIVPKMFENPVEAVQFINQQSSILQRSFLSPLDELPADHVGFDIDIRSFHQKILQQNLRFRELTVVVCDYAMPQKNGLEVLQEVKNKDLKTIMLTGEADELLAVEAFNRGLIDHFMRKSVTNFTEKLNSIILSLQQDYIMRITDLMINNIVLGRLPSPCVLTDPAFINLFNFIKQQHHIAEYYLIDEHGGYLLLDQKGQTFFLAILDPAALDSFLQFAIDEQAPAPIIEKLKSKQFVPFFYSDEDLNTPPRDWDSYLYPAQTLEGQQTYYYCLITPPTQMSPVLTNEQTYQYFLEHGYTRG